MNEKIQKNDSKDIDEDTYCWFCAEIVSQIIVWIFDIVIIINLIIYNILFIFKYSSFINLALGFISFINYLIYLFINFLSPINNFIGNKLTDLEIINKIQNIIKDNTFNDTIINYECYYFSKLGEKRN